MLHILYKKTIENDKIIFYSQHFQSLWQYIRLNGYPLQLTLVFFAIPAISCTIEILIFDSSSPLPIGNKIIGLLLCLLFLFIILGLSIRAKKFFFELTVSKKEISFYTPRQQWTYKVADIKKIREKNRSADDYYVPIFFIEIEPFPNQLLADCRVFFIIKDLCQHTGISLEEGNLVKF